MAFGALIIAAFAGFSSAVAVFAMGGGFLLALAAYSLVGATALLGVVAVAVRADALCAMRDGLDETRAPLNEAA